MSFGNTNTTTRTSFVNGVMELLRALTTLIRTKAPGPCIFRKRGGETITNKKSIMVGELKILETNL